MKNTYLEQVRAGSPCKGICTTTFDPVCQGCGRTVDEVANWVIMDEEEQQAVWDRVINWGEEDG